MFYKAKRLIKVLRNPLGYYKEKKFYRTLKSCNNDFDSTAIFRYKSMVSNSKFGKYSGLNYGCEVSDTIFGNYTIVAENVKIGPRSHIFTNFSNHDYIYQNQEFVFSDDNKVFGAFMNKIGNDVWIGCNAIVLPGIEIGNGAIVAAGSIVTKSVPPYAIVGGNPARFISWRFEKSEIKKLEETQWYTWPIEKVLLNKIKLEAIVSFDIELFKKKYYTAKPMMVTK